MLAAKWLAAGFDSQPLRQLAQLQSGESPAEHRSGDFAEPIPVQGDRQLRAALSALDLMPDALRSIGFDPAAADEAFTARCQSALDIVQHDLDVTGYGQYRMQARLGRGWPASVYATLPDGSYRAAGGEGMTRDLDGSWLLFAAAESVSATIEEVHEIEWGRSALSTPMTPGPAGSPPTSGMSTQASAGTQPGLARRGLPLELLRDNSPHMPRHPPR